MPERIFCCEQLMLLINSIIVLPLLSTYFESFMRISLHQISFKVEQGIKLHASCIFSNFYRFYSFFFMILFKSLFTFLCEIIYLLLFLDVSSILLNSVTHFLTIFLSFHSYFHLFILLYICLHTQFFPHLFN